MDTNARQWGGAVDGPASQPWRVTRGLLARRLMKWSRNGACHGGGSVPALALEQCSEHKKPDHRVPPLAVVPHLALGKLKNQIWTRLLDMNGTVA